MLLLSAVAGWLAVAVVTVGGVVVAAVVAGVAAIVAVAASVDVYFLLIVVC